MKNACEVNVHPLLRSTLSSISVSPICGMYSMWNVKSSGCSSSEHTYAWSIPRSVLCLSPTPILASIILHETGGLYHFLRLHNYPLANNIPYSETVILMNSSYFSSISYFKLHMHRYTMHVTPPHKCILLDDHMVHRIDVLR